jgi:hypothetical protein
MCPCERGLISRSPIFEACQWPVISQAVRLQSDSGFETVFEIALNRGRNDSRNRHLELAARLEFNRDDWSMQKLFALLVWTGLIGGASESFAVSPSVSVGDTVSAGDTVAASAMPGGDSSAPRPLAGIRWHRDFDQGWAEARRIKRPLLIYITAPGCVYCEAMKRDTWCDKSVESAVGQAFVAIELSPEDNAKVISRIKVKTYPMTLIGIPEGKIIAHRDGYQPPGEMKTLLKSIFKPR